MENVKINLKLLLPLLCNLLIAEPIKLSLPEAIERFKIHDIGVRQQQERMLLLEQQTTLHDHRFQPRLTPIQASFNPIDNKGKVSSGVSWTLPTGGNIAFNVSKTDTEDPHYNVKFDQTLSKEKSAQDKQSTLQIEIEHLSSQDILESKFIEFRKLYRNCVQEALSLKQQVRMLSAFSNAVKKHKLMYEHGEISKLELEKTISVLERKAINLLKLERQHELNLIKLKQRLGIDYNAQITLDESIQFLDNLLTPAQAISQAFRHNRPYKISLLKNELAKLQYCIARSSQQPKINVFGTINQDYEATLGVSLKIEMPSEKTEYIHAKNTLDYVQSQQSVFIAENDLKTNIHSALISLTHQKSLIELATKNLKQQQTIFQAESLKLQYHEISVEAFDEASEKIESAFLESITAQINYCDAYESLMQSTGAFDTLNNNRTT